MQVHSHPSDWTGHSQTDDDFSIASSPGFVSLVWPDYAVLPARTIDDLGVHRLIDGKWRHLSGESARLLIRVVESEAMVWAPQTAPLPARQPLASIAPFPER
jgi:hypothetical protein